MPFVKLDCGILNSTLWVEPIERDIFITALLMAVPFEFKTPQPQIAVSEIRETGFIVPPGWYGKVEAAGPGIVRRALIEQEPGMKALSKLGEPDPGSRSQAWEGRRLIRVDGGYLVLNYMDYLLKDYGAAERMRRLRARKRDAVTVTDVDVTRTVTYIYADTDANKNKSADGGTRPSPSTDVGKNPESKTPIPIHNGIPEDQGFARLRSLYPKRDGSQRWADAEKHYRARLKEGVSRETIEDGVMRYAKYCRIKEIEGTEYVQQAATFLGRNRGFDSIWKVKAEGQARHLKTVN